MDGADSDLRVGAAAPSQTVSARVGDVGATGARVDSTTFPFALFAVWRSTACEGEGVRLGHAGTGQARGMRGAFI